MTPIEVIEYLESHPLDEEFVKILQQDYEFDLYEEDIDSFLFYHYGQMTTPYQIGPHRWAWVEYTSPQLHIPSTYGDFLPAHPDRGELSRALRRTPTGRLDTFEVFQRRASFRELPGEAAKIEIYQKSTGERGLRFKYYRIKLIGEDWDEEMIETPLEDYYRDSEVREEWMYGDYGVWWTVYEYVEFELPYRFRLAMLNYPRGGNII